MNMARQAVGQTAKRKGVKEMDRCNRDCDSCLVLDCQDVEGQGVYRQVLGDVELMGADDDRGYVSLVDMVDA